MAWLIVAMSSARRTRSFLAAACVLAGSVILGGCAHRARPVSQAAAAGKADWRSVVTVGDRERLRRWRSAWMDALAAARAGSDVAVVAGGVLYDPDLALPEPLPPPGAYLCRVHKLGTIARGGQAFRSFPPVACRVAQQAGAIALYGVTGSQRPVGVLYDQSPTRAMFLGTLVLGDESRPLRYGQDVQRDVAGYVERIGPRRWRLVLPYPHFESLLDVIELTPDPAQD